MRAIAILFLSILLWAMNSCDKKVVQSPKKPSKDTYLQESIELEKARQAKEYDLLSGWIKDNAQFELEKSEYGYWIHSKINNDNPIIDELDEIQYVKQYKDLNQNIIYTYEENGMQYLKLGKSQEIRGIETAMRSMSEGSSATLLLPSFMAYGLYGDEHKIGGNKPILVEFEILKVIKK